MDNVDTKPWYRQFWPWFLILPPAAAVVAGIYTISLAVSTSDSLVMVADDGMDVVTERNLAAERYARDMGIAATLAIDTDTGAINATVVADSDVEWPKTVELMFSHPAFAERDQTVTLAAALPDAAGNAVWSGFVVDVPSGRWYLVLKSADDWRLNGTWTGSSEVRLLPAGVDDGA